MIARGKTPTRRTRRGEIRGGNILEYCAEVFKPAPSSAGAFRQQVIQWFFAAKLLRVFEADKLTDHPTAEDLASHRLICSAMIAFGEFAATFARRHPQEVNLQAVELSVACIEAETRLLQNNFKMFHDDSMTRSEAEAILQDAFHEA